jgi:hypothetical protein
MGTQTHQRVTSHHVRAFAGHARQISALRGPFQSQTRDVDKLSLSFAWAPFVRPMRG